MTRDTIIKLAREAGMLPNQEVYAEDLERFAAIVAAAEREACAKVCYDLPWKDADCIPSNLAFAAAIRARSQQ